MSVPVLQMVPQRHPCDCGAACLAMCAGVSYEDALLALGGVVPDILRAGVYFTELKKAAKKLNVALKVKRRPDLENDEGLLHVKFKSGPHHVVVLSHNLIFDTDGTIWEPESYLSARKAKFGTMLVRDE